MKNKELHKQFVKRLEPYGFSQREWAVLFGKTTRCICYYCRGERGIPTAIWARLKELEEIPRDELCKIITKKMKK